MMSSWKLCCWNRWKLLFLLHFASVLCDANGDTTLPRGRAYTERPLSGTDRVAILQRDNDEIRYNSISRGEECILKKFVRRKDVERCENLEREHCEPEFVLVRREVRENCTLQKEFCETSHRKQRVDSDTVLCQLEYDIDCDDSDDDDDLTALEIARRTRRSSDAVESCHPRRTAICKRKSRMVTITEKKQKCNGDDSYRTTKMCLTHLSGEGDCVDLSRDGDFCDDRDEMKVIVSEVVREGGKMECSMISEDEDKGFCHPLNCRVTSNRTDCVSDSMPEMFDLKETVCERCVDERVKVRPVVEERTVCRKTPERFCLNVTEESVNWRKWCRDIIVNGRRVGAKENSNRREDKEVYHIEVSPGRWVITSNKGEVDSLFRDQRNNGHHDESHKEDKEESPEEEYLECVKQRNHKSCRFISK